MDNKKDKYTILKWNFITLLGKRLYRIQALKNFSDVKEGDLGGYVESGDNLSQEGDCWLYNNSKVCDNSRICDNVKIYGDSEIYGNSRIYGSSEIFNCCIVNSTIHGKVKVLDSIELIENKILQNNE